MVLKFMVLSVIIFITVYLVLLLKSPMPFQLMALPDLTLMLKKSLIDSVNSALLATFLIFC